MRAQFLKKSFITGVSSFALLATLITPAQALVVRDDVTVEGSEQNSDDPKWDGAIQLYLQLPDGRIFFNCSGSVINARTIITAAHCFNSSPSTAYGVGPGQNTPIIAYGLDTFDALFRGISNDRTGFTFGTSVILHPDADPANGNFLDFPGADVAMVSLQDPLTTIPSYSLLFSPVPVGTHVTQVAYGGHGVGTTGDVGIDGKRQIGENIIGLIGSQNDFIRGVFNSPNSAVFGNLEGEQSLYWIDFDDPDRQGGECVRTDLFGFTDSILCDGATQISVQLGNSLLAQDSTIDYFPGDALPGEAGTAGGDSGSAIFVDQLGADPLIAGVLSGGFTFTATVGSGYGDVSYYNPLFNFYNFIAEFNPYKYVSANAGDGNWSDVSHWVQDLDPGYFIIDANGNLVNGLPTGPEPGVQGDGPKEGIIFDVDINDVQPDVQEEGGQGGEPASAGIEVSSTIATGEVGITATNFVANGEVGVTASNLVTNSNGVASTATLDGIEAEPEVETFFNGQFDAPSAANGPGATGFTPNNSQLFLANGDVNTNFFAEYFDVTLRNAGTTFADIDFIEIDKLTIDNNDARLVINDTTDFTSIIDTQIASGTLEVNGIFTSRDILNGGLVTGTGNIFADAFFNVGMINAGEGFTINGDVILTSNGILAYSGNALNVNGDVSIDGGLLLGFDGAPTFGTTGTVLNYTGTRVGEFSSVSDLPGVLFAFVDYSQNGTVTFDIQAQDFAQFIGIDATPNQKAIAGFLDGNRGNFAALSDLFNSIDLLSGQALTTALDTIAPGNALNEISTGFSRNETLSGQVGRRIGALGNGNSRGVAQFSANGDAFGGSSTLLTANALGSFVANAAGHASQVTLKEGWGMFGDVTYYTGDADTTLSGVNAELDGFSFTGGADYQFDNTAILGVYVNYGSGDMQHNGFLNTSDFTGIAAGVYGNMQMSETFAMSGYLGYGSRDADLARTVVVGAQTQNITGKADSNELIGGAEVSARLARADGKFVLRPSLRYDFASFDVDSYTETGGSAALIIGKQDNKSSQISAGANLDIHLDQANGNLTPTFGGRFVHDFAAGGSNAVNASFVNAPGTSVTLLGAQRDEDWFEVDAGIDFNMSERVSAQLQVARTLDRKDIDYTSFSAKLSVRF